MIPCSYLFPVLPLEQTSQSSWNTAQVDIPEPNELVSQLNLSNVENEN